MSRCWHQTHMKQAELMAERSTCAKLSVGAVLVRDNRTISQGYNGVGPKCMHCNEYWHQVYLFDKEYIPDEYKSFDDFLQSNYFRNAHKLWSIEHELHAEQNCILWAAREGIRTADSTLYTIYSPCINCAKVIHMAGVKKVYYKFVYASDQSGIQYLIDNLIQCIELKQN